MVGKSSYANNTPEAGEQAYRWTEATGMTFLGNTPDGAKPYTALAISGDGRVITGSIEPTGAPFIWTQSSGTNKTAFRLQDPVAVSYDGSIIYGQKNFINAYGGVISDTSWDGRTVVGTAFFEAFVDNNGVITWLGALPGGDYSSKAYAVSADGTMVVGWTEGVLNVNGVQVPGPFAFRWSKEEGMVALGPWAGSGATDVSANKIVAVGSGSPITNAPAEGYRWTPATGMVLIRDLLMAEGIDVVAMGWNLYEPQAVSANGRVIVGNGIQSGVQKAWLVELTVPGDFDDNGNLDGNDFLIWQRGFGGTYNAGDLANWQVNSSFASQIGGAAISAIPEPCAATLWILATSTLVLRRRAERLPPSID